MLQNQQKPQKVVLLITYQMLCGKHLLNLQDTLDIQKSEALNRDYK